MVKRLETAFTTKEAPWTWEEVTYDDLKSIMKDDPTSVWARSFQEDK